LYEKILQNTTFWMNLKEIFFPYYIVCLGMLFLMVLYLFKHFKVKYAIAFDKSLVSVFLKE
jgi:hypothetical protein